MVKNYFSLFPTCQSLFEIASDLNKQIKVMYCVFLSPDQITHVAFIQPKLTRDLKITLVPTIEQ
jgi:hypothetical protein